MWCYSLLDFCSDSKNQSVMNIVQHKERERERETASLFVLKNKLNNQTFHHVRRWEETHAAEHVWTQLFFFKDEQESRFHEKIPSPCTTVLLYC